MEVEEEMVKEQKQIVKEGRGENRKNRKREKRMGQKMVGEGM